MIYGTWDNIQQELHYINRIEVRICPYTLQPPHHIIQAQVAVERSLHSSNRHQPYYRHITNLFDVQPAPLVLGCQGGLITISEAGALTLAVSLAGALCLVMLLFWWV